MGRRKGRLRAGAVAGTAAAMLPWLTAAAATSSPNDYFFAQGDQWALSGAAASIDSPHAWCASTGAGVTIADIDTGADFGHPDLAGKLIAGARFTDGTGNPSSGGVQDDNGHGSMTTGIMVADTNNGAGIAAVAPDARALVVKVLDGSGGGHDNDVAAGIEWASENGARVINLSLGPDIPFTSSLTATSAIPGAIRDAAGRGVAVAIAAGNDGLFLDQYQQTQIQKYALVVGALNPDGSVAGYSDGADIYAPGGSGSGDVHSQVVSTYIDTTTGQHGYAYGSGTSFATPQVAGVLAQLMSRGYSAAAAEQRIIATAPSAGGIDRLDAARALGAVATCGAPPPATAAPRPAGGGGTQSGGGPAVTPPGASGAATPSAAVTPGPATQPRTGALTPIGNTPSSPSPVVWGISIAGVVAVMSGALALRGRLLRR